MASSSSIDPYAAEKRPVTGVSVALFDGARVLVVLRGKEPYKGFWSLPGGAQEWGETLEAAARRELAEETGLKATQLHFMRFIEPVTRAEDGTVLSHYVLALFAGYGHQGVLQPADDAEAAQWIDVGALNTLTMTPGTVERIVEMQLALAGAADTQN